MDTLAVWLQATQERHEAGDVTTLPDGWAEAERALARICWALGDTERAATGARSAA